MRRAWCVNDACLQLGRKRLGRDRAGGGSRTDGGGGLTGIERVRHHDGDHVFYLYVTAELGILCVTDGIPVDQEVQQYRLIATHIREST